MTATTLTPSAVPVRRSSGWRGFGVLLATEARLWLRDPGTVFFALVFPTGLSLCHISAPPTLQRSCVGGVGGVI